MAKAKQKQPGKPKPPKKAAGGLWYLAGPFFNPAQRQHAEELAAFAAEARGEDNVYAPVSAGVTLDTAEKAKEVYDTNVERLLACGVLLAQVEWLLPEGQENRIVEPHYIGHLGQRAEQLRGERGVAVHLKSGPLNVPDSGTVWELGMARGIRERDAAASKASNPPKVPFIVAYTVGEQSQLNLMLARSCDAYLRGREALERFLLTEELEDDELAFRGKEL